MKIFLFMLIFMFPIPLGNFSMSSNYIVGLCLIIYSFVNPNFRKEFFFYLNQWKIMKIFFGLCLIIMYCFIIPSVLETYDYTIIPTFFNQFVNLFIGLLLFSLYKLNRKENMITKDLIFIFVIQGIIQLISSIFPQINNMLNMFRYEGTVERALSQYGGIRGLAISGSAFFTLSLGYGVIYIYFLDNWSKILPKYPVLRLLVFVFLLFSGLTTARSSIAGLIMGLSYIIFKNANLKEIKIETKNFKNKIISSILILILISVPSTLAYIVFGQVKTIKNTFNRIFSFLFEFFETFKETGTVGTNSTDYLFTNMYFNVPLKDFIFGEGRYTSFTGSYYKGTDAGYMRNILFFGIIGIFMLVWYQCLFFVWNKKSSILLNLTVLIYVLIMQIKGEAMGFAIILQNILFLKFLQDTFGSNLDEI